MVKSLVKCYLAPAHHIIVMTLPAGMDAETQVGGRTPGVYRERGSASPWPARMPTSVSGAVRLTWKL